MEYCGRVDSFLHCANTRLLQRSAFHPVCNKRNVLLTLSLLFAVFLWGGSNTGTKFIVGTWPPIWTGASRFVCAGLLLLLLLRFTHWLGAMSPLDSAIKRRLWWR